MIKKKKNKILSQNKTSVYDVFYQEILIARIKSYKDYVKNKETDTIRTKWTKLQDIIWEKSNLVNLFPTKVEEINQLSNHYKIEPKEGSASFWIELDLKKLL